MAGKSKKKKAKANKNGEKKKTTKAKKTVRKGGRSKSSRCTVDIFTEAAMENAYTTCHNVQDLLKWRGFPWPDGQKKKRRERNK